MSNTDTIIPIRAAKYVDEISHLAVTLEEDQLDGHEASEIIDQSLIFHSNQGAHGTLEPVDTIGERAVVPPIAIGDHRIDIEKQIQVYLKEHLVQYTDGSYAMVPPMTVTYTTLGRNNNWWVDSPASLLGHIKWTLTDTAHGGWAKPFNGGIIKNPSWLGLNNVYRYGNLCFGSYDDRIDDMRGLFMPDVEDRPILTVEGARTLTDLFVTSRDNGDLEASAMILTEGNGHIFNTGGSVEHLHCMRDYMGWELQANLAIIMAAMLHELDLVDPLDFLDRCYERSLCHLMLFNVDNDPIDSYGVFFVMQDAFLHKHHPDVDRMTPSQELTAALREFWTSFLSVTPYGKDRQLDHPIDLRYECQTQAIGWLPKHPRWEYWQVLKVPPSVSLTGTEARTADLDHPKLAQEYPFNVVKGYDPQRYVNNMGERVSDPDGHDAPPEADEEFEFDDDDDDDEYWNPDNDPDEYPDDDPDEDLDEDTDEDTDEDSDDGFGVMPDTTTSVAMSVAAHTSRYASQKHESEPEPSSHDETMDLQDIIYHCLLNALI